jgi:hypothetical protein
MTRHLTNHRLNGIVVGSGNGCMSTGSGPLPRAKEGAGPPVSRVTPSQRALYIEDMIGQLERLARGSELAHLRDLLRVAREEARRRAFG